MSATVPGAAGASAAPEIASISLGAANSDGTLRLWLAQQAVAKGEALLGAQIGSIGRLSTSATSILGWSVTVSLALIAAIPSTIAPASQPPGGTAALQSLLPGHLLWPAVAALVSILLAAVCCVVVLWPGYWRPPGHAPDLLLDTPYDTELEVLEAMASGYADAVALNAGGLNRLEIWLRAAWLSLAGAPFIGAATFLVEVQPWLPVKL